MTAAISSVLATRPTGMSAASLASFSGVVCHSNVGVDCTGANGVDCYSGGGDLARERFGEAEDRSLGRRIRHLAEPPPPRSANTDDMLTMRPQPCSIISGRNALVTR